MRGVMCGAAVTAGPLTLWPHGCTLPLHTPITNQHLFFISFSNSIFILSQTYNCETPNVGCLRGKQRGVRGFVPQWCGLATSPGPGPPPPPAEPPACPQCPVRGGSKHHGQCEAHGPGFVEELFKYFCLSGKVFGSGRLCMDEYDRGASPHRMGAAHGRVRRPHPACRLRGGTPQTHRKLRFFTERLLKARR